LRNRIASRDAVVGVIGQGYVGLPLALVFHEGGFRVLGFDIDPAKVAALSRGESFIQHIGSERVTAAIASGKYAVTADFDRLRECDAIFICVPTPLGAHREPDNSYIHDTARAIAGRLRSGQLVVLESTTIREPPRRKCCPSWSRAGCPAPATSCSRSPPSARTPAERTSAPGPSPSWWAA
jgi:UDP-N-acetyl-D-glucosamine dehydrogenase